MPASTPPGLASIGAESFVRPIRDGEPDAKTEGEKTDKVFEKSGPDLRPFSRVRVKVRSRRRMSGKAPSGRTRVPDKGKNHLHHIIHKLLDSSDRPLYN